MSEAKGSTKLGHGLAKVLGIQLEYRNPTGKPEVTRGESMHSVSSADSYIEQEPSSIDWIRETVPTGHQVVHYFVSLFPFLKWLPRYNVQWLIGDLIAGITVGAVVVPQSMSYAGLANLPPQFGLYSSFMGVLIYWFFATSKDITIGPVAVMSKLTGEIVEHTWKSEQNCAPDAKGDYVGAGCFPPHIIASALAIVAGGIICGIGLLRLGWIVDFIPLVAIAAFMTGASLNILVGQVPNLLGEPAGGAKFDTRAQTYKVIIETLKNLKYCQVDAAMGLTALFMLYAWRWFCNTMAKKQPNRAKMWFFISTIRTAFVILFYVFISAMVNLHLHRSKDGAKDSPFAILGPVPRGFQNAAVPKINSNIVSKFTSDLPAAVIVLLIEHISISKSFGRVNNYTINPSQEMVAIGVTNLLGPFLGAYPATGSFSRTAIKSKAGVRTPFAGVITAVVVLLAIYALPVVFFYIPSASLSAVIIHAVGDLITPPNTVYQFWKISPLEVIIFFAGVLVTVFTTIENGIYTTVAVSLALFLWRVFKAKGHFLGRVKVHSVIGDQYIDSNSKTVDPDKSNKDPESSARNIFIPIDSHDGSNPNVAPQHPYPGVFIYRFSEGFNYPNANHYLDQLTDEVFRACQRTNPHSYPRPGDRPWNDPGPRKGHEVVANDHRPTLKAIILDFSSINNVDITSVQNLVDVRNQLDRFASPEKVQWHFACINSRWTKRALASAGFGYATPEGDKEFYRWKPVFSIAEIGGTHSAAADAERARNRRASKVDVEQGERTISREADSIESDESNGGYQKELKSTGVTSKIAMVHGINRPFFHLDLTSALQAAIRNSEGIKIVEKDHGVIESDVGAAQK